MKKLLLITVGIFCVLTSLFSQGRCGFDDFQKKMMADHPEIAPKIQASEQAMQQYIAAHPELKSPKLRQSTALATVTIPVVVHIIHTGGDVGTLYNPDDQTIIEAIDHLNRVFRAATPETNGSVDLGIQFVLARRSPDCNPTTGIERIDGSVLANYANEGVGEGGTDELSLKNLSRWDPSKYYNIWVVNKINGNDGSDMPYTAGYAYHAGTPSNYDGMVILSRLTSKYDETLAHELGHAFNLLHVFEGGDDTQCPINDDCNNDNDKVCDTDPVTMTMDYPRTGAINPCTGGFYTDNTERNFMSYAQVRLLFTPGQRARVAAALSLPSRSCLASSIGSLSPEETPACAPQISFTTGTSTVKESSAAADAAVPCRGYKDYTYQLKSNMALTQPVTATLNLGGTALAGQDYDITTNGNFASPSKELVFSAGETKSFTLRVYDDKALEPTKTIVLTLSLNNGAQTGDIYPNHTVTLLDDDNMPMPNFGGTITTGSNLQMWQVGQNCFSGGDFSKHRVQYLYRASELNAAGLTNAATLSALTFYYYSHTSAAPYKGLTVSMSNTANATIESFVPTDGFTAVYSGDYMLQAGPSTTIPFTTNFNWDGVSNILINICYDNEGVLTATDQLLGGSATLEYVSVYNKASSTGTTSACSLPAGGKASTKPKISFAYAVTSGAPVETSVTSQTEYLGPNAEVYFKNSAGKIMAAVKNMTSYDYGCTQVTIDRAGTSAVPFWNNTPVNYLASKTFKVIPANNSATGSYQIRLYYTKAEIDGWMAATGKTLAEASIAKISNGHTISEVTPVSPYFTDISSVSLGKTSFGADTIVTATFSNTGFSGFAIGVLGAPTPLPVTWLSFEGRKKDEAISLTWSTATEVNNDHFNVETSKDGNVFYKIGQIKGKSTTDLHQTYSFTDNAPAEGTNYYRLKQVDVDGKFVYSKTISIAFAQTKTQIFVFPNPVKDKLNIEFSKKEKSATLQIFTIDGRMLRTTHMNLPSQKATIDVSSLAKGIYVLEIITTNNEKSHFRFVKE